MKDTFENGFSNRIIAKFLILFDIAQLSNLIIHIQTLLLKIIEIINNAEIRVIFNS
jgi:hypothetical protein